MPTTTTKFDDIVANKISRKKSFGDAMLKEAVKSFFQGELDSSKAMIKWYVKGTIGIKNLSDLLGKNEKSVLRMLGPKGNPTLNNFCALFKAIQQNQGIKIDANIHKTKDVQEDAPRAKRRRKIRGIDLI